jgi:hypothetical protein
MEVIRIKRFRRPTEMTASQFDGVPEHAAQQYNVLLQVYDDARDLFTQRPTIKNRKEAEKTCKTFLEYQKWLLWFFVPPPVEPPPPDAKTKELTCCVCLVKQVNRCLPCGHTLCSLCLPEMLKRDDCACPTCRAPFAFKSVSKLFI